MPSQQFPNTRWVVKKGPTVAISSTQDSIFLTEAVDPEAVLRMISLDGDNPQRPIKMMISEIASAKGRKTALGAITCLDDYGRVYSHQGAVYVNCGDELRKWSVQTGTWDVVVHADGMWMEANPIFHQASIFCLWSNSRQYSILEDTGEPEFKISMTSGRRVQWSESLRAPGFPADWRHWRDSLYVRCRSAPMSGGEGQLWRIDSRDLTVQGQRPTKDGLCLAGASGQLFCDEEYSVKVGADMCRPVTPGATFAGLEVVGDIRLKDSQSVWNLCAYDLPSLELRKRWTLSGRVRRIDLADSGRGLVITEEGLIRGATIQILSSRTPYPVTVSGFEQQPVGVPVQFGVYTAWLLHEGGNIALHDEWPLALKRRPQHESVVQWFDEKSQVWRRATPMQSWEPIYRLFLLNLETGESRDFPIEIGESFSDIVASGPNLLLVGRQRLHALSFDSLWTKSKPTAYRKLQLLGDPVAPEMPVLCGLPFTGPRSDDWGASFESSASNEFLRAHASPKTLNDADARATTTDNWMDWAISRVLSKWPDTARILARECPATLLTNTVQITGSFGAVKFDSGFVENVNSWRSQVENRIARGTETEVEHTPISRFLLHEYIRRCHNRLTVREVANSGPEAAVSHATRESIQRFLAWCVLATLRSPSDERSKTWSRVFIAAKACTVLTAVLAVCWGAITYWLPIENAGIATACGWTALGLGLASAGLWKLERHLLFVRDPHLSHLDIVRLEETWPGACPPMIQDPGGYFEFLRICATMGLFAPQHRSRLQSAVCRAWQNPIVRRGTRVFVSYSHTRASEAARIVDELSKRGIRVSFDALDLRTDAGDWEVEEWIAEQLMAADALIYLISREFLSSGWINREAEWSVRLMGVKPQTVPYLVYVDSTPVLRDYPQGRIVDAQDIAQRTDAQELFDELAARITVDALRAFAFGSRRDAGDIS